MRSPLTFFVVLLACASLSTTDSFAGRPSGGGSPKPVRGGLTLSSATVVPIPGELTDFMTMTVNVGRDQVCFNPTVNQLTGFITTIGIYRGRAGETGPMVVRLCPSSIGINQLIGCVSVADADLMRDMSRNPSNYYVQINTNLHPGGDARAQLR